MSSWILRRAERQLREAVPPDRVGAVLAELFDDHREKVREAGAFRAHLWLLVESRSLVKAYSRRDGSPPGRISPWCHSVAQDLGYALRSLRRQPTFALVPMGALAIAIGLAVSLFTAFNAIILRPWPVKDPGRVVSLFTQGPEGALGFSIPEFRYFAGHTTTFAGLVVRSSTAAYVGDEAVDKATRGTAVSENFFAVLGVPMALGRSFATDDDRGDAPHAVAILNYRFWQSRFSGSANVIGAQVRLNGVPFSIIGVAAQTFPGLEPSSENFWIPLSALPLLDADAPRWLNEPHHCCYEVAGRLNPGVTRSLAGTEIGVLSRQFRSQFALIPQPILVAGTTFLERPNSKRQALPILGLMALGALLMLIIACANVGSLLLARAVARAREMGVRLSLGASRTRLIRQLLTESLVLAFVAGAIGTALAYRLPDRMLAMAGEPPPFPIVPDPSVLAFALLLTLAVCVGAGLAPAIHGTHDNVLSALKETGSVAGLHLRARRLLMTLQVAVSVCLLTGAALSARSIQHAEAVDVDFAARDISIVTFATPSGASARTFGPAFFSDLADSLHELHLQPFGLTEAPPLSGFGRSISVRLAADHSGEQQARP